MQAGLSDHVWSLEELCALIPEPESGTKRIEKHLLLNALPGE